MTKTCGIHVTFTWPCVHCARAARQTADALSHVVAIPVAAPKSNARTPTPQAVIDQIRELHEQKLSATQIARQLGVSTATVWKWTKVRVGGGTTDRTASHQYFAPIKGEREYRQTLPAPRASRHSAA